jgi:hypothetical protein
LWLARIVELFASGVERLAHSLGGEVVKGGARLFDERQNRRHANLPGKFQFSAYWGA